MDRGFLCFLNSNSNSRVSEGDWVWIPSVLSFYPYFIPCCMLWNARLWKADEVSWGKVSDRPDFRWEFPATPNVEIQLYILLCEKALCFPVVTWYMEYSSRVRLLGHVLHHQFSTRPHLSCLILALIKRTSGLREKTNYTANYCVLTACWDSSLLFKV